MAEAAALDWTMPMDEWQVDSLDLEGYLADWASRRARPAREALAELHEAHVRTFTFDNIDVLLGRHPGVSLDAVQEKFVGRGRGGYCFEHSTMFAAALERLGYRVRRHLGRVGDPATGAQQGRTHMVVEVVLDGQRLLCDPGFGMSLLRPIPMEDDAQDEHPPGWRYRVRRTTAGGWALDRLARGRLGGRPHDRRARGDAGRRGHGAPLHEHLPRARTSPPASCRQAPARPARHGDPRVVHRAHPGGADGAPAPARGEVEEWLTTLEVPLTPRRAGPPAREGR